MKESAYKAAGVDIEAGDNLVDRILPLARKTGRPGVMGDLGGFGALFDLKEAGFKDPVLVSSTDGVGTKLKIAIETGMHDTVGIDLVAMSVNDLVTTGADPLFFLDYFACGKLDVGVAARVIAGIAHGCSLAGCALTGGETAEMPGMYAPGDYDLAGFAVGAAERSRIISGDRIAAGDVILGLTSSGVHSNGYSLVRKIVADSKLPWRAPTPFTDGEGRDLATCLMAPTRIYVQSLKRLFPLNGTDGQPLVRGLAHITGGGLPENAARMVPQNLMLHLDASAWALPPVFAWLANAAGLTADDLALTFNCGIGMIVICHPADADKAIAELTQAGEAVYRIGSVSPRAEGASQVEIRDRESAWQLKN